MDAGTGHTNEALITLVAAVSAGTFLMGVAQRIGIPAIVLLLGGGILLGPEVIGIIQPDSLGSVLTALVSLAVGIILFEAGMTLDFAGYRTASKVIQRLLTVGTLITWLGTTVAIYFIFGASFDLALLAASLVIVTGPTVVLPLLKRIRVIPRLHHILQWEGVLIDPIGVFVAILCFEYLTSGSGMHAATDFGLRIIVGVFVGLVGGFLTYFILKKRLAPEHMVGVATLACAAFTFGLAELVIAESGLLSTIVAGFVPAILKPIDIKRVLLFKAEVADLLIAVLFMVLASRLEVQQFLDFGWRGWLVVAVVMVIVRPVNILVSTAGQGLGWKEKTFLSWLAPRGIVAASMASLFRIMLEENAMFSDPAFIETFTYSVIMTTIVVEGLLANRVAILLGLKRPDATGWLLVGAHEFSRRLADYFSRSGLSVAVVDSNSRAVKTLLALNVSAFQLDARDPALFEHEQLMNMGNVLALTDNEDLNLVICSRLADVVGRDHVFAWVSGSGSSPMASEKVRTVWSNLPKPSMLSNELSHYESRMFQIDGSRQAPADSVVVATIAPKSVTVLPDTPGSPPGEDVTQIVIVRSSNHLRRSLSIQNVVDASATDLHDALGSAFEVLLIQFPKLPTEQLLKEVIAREREFPTVLKHGIAVPHAYTRHINQRICCIIRSPEGVFFGEGETQERVFLMFLVISPSGDPEGHLAIMAEIAHLISNEDMRTQLLSAHSAADIFRLIDEDYQ